MITTFQLGGDAIGNVPPHFFACKRPDFKPIFNRLLSRCVCLRGSAPYPSGGITASPEPQLETPYPAGGLTAPPDPQLEKLGHRHRSFSQLTPKMNPPLSKSWLRACFTVSSERHWQSRVNRIAKVPKRKVFRSGIRTLTLDRPVASPTL